MISQAEADRELEKALAKLFKLQDDKATRVTVDPGPKKKQRHRPQSGGVAISHNMRENRLDTQGDYITMADIRLDSEFFNHPKTGKLERACGESGIISLLKLWTWAAANRPDGNLSGLDDEDIELAAKWCGESGAFASALVRLHWLDGEPGQYRLHGWAEHNPWTASAVRRDATSRMNILKRYHPKIYEELNARGIKRLSKAQYGELVAGQKTFDEIEAELDAMAEAEQTQRDARADAELGAALDKLLDPSARAADDEQSQAINALMTFPANKGRKLSPGVAAAWVSRMQVRYPKIKLSEAIRDAAQYVTDNEISVGSPRAFLNSLFEKLYGTTPKA